MKVLLTLFLLMCSVSHGAPAAARDLKSAVMEEIQHGLKRTFPKSRQLTTRVDPPQQFPAGTESFQFSFVLQSVTEEISPRQVESWVAHFSPLTERAKTYFPNTKLGTWTRFMHGKYVQDSGRDTLPTFSILLQGATTLMDLRVDFIDRGEGLLIVSCTLVAANSSGSE